MTASGTTNTKGAARMLGLPLQTEVKKQLPKNAIYTKFQMNTAQKEKIDSDIAKLVIVNEVNPSTINIEAGKEIKGFFVVHVTLKKKDYAESTIIQISKLIPQNILFVLEFEEYVQLATYHTKLMHTEWLPKEEPTITLKGFDFDTVWENIIINIGNIEIKQGNTLDEQIEVNEKIAKLERDIAQLEKQARAEKQPKKKFELAGRVNTLKKDLNLLKANSGLN